MLQASVLMFSRSFTKDYRWVYSAPCVTQTDKSELLKDYRAFELDRSNFLSKPHCVLRRVEDGVAVFCFSKTSQTDVCSRPIFAMTGLVFSGMDAEVLMALPHIILSALFSSELFESERWEVTDSHENCVRHIELSMDHMLNEYRKNPKPPLSEVNYKSIKTTLKDMSVLITRDGASPMKSELRNTLVNPQYSVDFDALLKSYEPNDSRGQNSYSSRYTPNAERYNGNRVVARFGRARETFAAWFNDRDDRLH